MTGLERLTQICNWRWRGVAARPRVGRRHTWPDRAMRGGWAQCRRAACQRLASRSEGHRGESRVSPTMTLEFTREYRADILEEVPGDDQICYFPRCNVNSRC